METSKNYDDIIKFIEDKSITEISLVFEGFQYVAEVLKSHGYEFYDMDTNGWDLDIWIIYKNEDDEISITGSMAYGTLELHRYNE